jgi:hypothetical protein
VFLIYTGTGQNTDFDAVWKLALPHDNAMILGHHDSPQPGGVLP